MNYQLKEAFQRILITNKLKMNQAFKQNGWVVILNYFDGRVEVTAHRSIDTINSNTSWKGFTLSKTKFEDIEEYVDKRTKGELKNNSRKTCTSRYLLLS